MGKNCPGLKKIWLDTSFGKVEAWVIQPVQGQTTKPGPWVIFAHGNCDLIDYWPKKLEKFRSFRIGVLLVEYPGYGRSEGTPSQESITEALVVAYDHLIAQREVDPSRIVLFGRSLGGGAVCALAAKRPCAVLILMSTFTGIKAFAPKFFVPCFIVRDPFSNLEVVCSFSGPMLVIHGRNDTLIPYDHGIALHRAGQQSEMITYDCGHNDCPPNWDIFWQDIESFLYKTGIIQ